jgi:hypothetical protein
MKKRFIFGMIALLSVSLFFLGCPTDANDDTASTSFLPPDEGGTRPSPAAQGKALAAALTAAGVSVKDDGNGGLTIDADTTLDTPVSVPAGVNLAVDPGVTLTVDAPLTVSSGGTLSVKNATLAVNETITVEGTFAVDGANAIDIQAGGGIEVTGTYNLAANAGGNNLGTVTIGPGGVVRNGANVNIGGGGTNVVQAGGTVYFNGDSVPFIGTDATAKFQVTQGTFTYTNGGYTLEGKATVALGNDDSGDAIARISEDKRLTLAAGAELTIAAAGSLRISNNSGAGGSAIKGTDATSKVIIEASSTGRGLYYNYASYSGGYTYFFENDGTTTTVSAADYSVAPGTYTWDATLVTNAGGWKL